MKAKYHFQLWQDVVLLLLLLSLMGFHLWQEHLHEWLGVAFLLLVMLHNVLNTHWFAALRMGAFTPLRLMQISINLLSALVILTAIVSGLLLSRYVLPDLPWHSDTDVMRKIHMTAVHWAQIVLAVHLGMHWQMLAKVFYKTGLIAPTSRLSNILLTLGFIAVSLYGGWVLVSRDMLPYLVMQVDFAFFDYEQPKWRFYLDYLAVVILIAYLTRSVLCWPQGNRPFSRK